MIYFNIKTKGARLISHKISSLKKKKKFTIQYWWKLRPPSYIQMNHFVSIWAKIEIITKKTLYVMNFKCKYINYGHFVGGINPI